MCPDTFAAASRRNNSSGHVTPRNMLDTLEAVYPDMKRAVRVDTIVNNIPVTNVGLMVTGKDRHMLSISAKMRKQMDKEIGDSVIVHLQHRYT